jgi:hypothetical protein
MHVNFINWGYRLHHLRNTLDTQENAVSWKVTQSGSFTTDVSKERITSIIRVTTIGDLGELGATSNRSRLRRNTENL